MLLEVAHVGLLVAENARTITSFRRIILKVMAQ